jgi:DNA-binding GntR family transcriptional regulator
VGADHDAALEPGAVLNVPALAERLGNSVPPSRRRSSCWRTTGWCTVTVRHGIYVAEADAAELAELSELRLPLEGLAARLAAERATADDLVVLEALCREQESLEVGDAEVLFDLDHRFHQAIAAAAHNRYLARTLEQFFGLVAPAVVPGAAAPRIFAGCRRAPTWPGRSHQIGDGARAER